MSTPSTSAGSAPARSLSSIPKASMEAMTSGGAPPTTGQGRTRIADSVVSTIAGVAAREVDGVHQLGGGAARALGSLRERIPGASTSAGQGVSVEVGEKQAAVDIDLVVEYGVAIADLAAAVRRHVTGALERMTGLQVVEVNITATDVHLPSDSSDPGDDSGGHPGSGQRSSGPRVR